MTAEYQFKSDESLADLKSFLLKAIPCARNVFKACHSNDKAGVDYWVEQDRKCLKIEIKQPSSDFRSCLPIEWVSQKEFDKPGWSVDASKATDFVIWRFPNNTTVMLPFSWLCFCALANEIKWRQQFPPKTQKTYGLYGDVWESEFSWVHFDTLFQDLKKFSYRTLNG